MAEDVALDLQVKTVPHSPGVYKYFDKDDTIIYVGKAKNLKKRVTSYFSKSQQDAKTRILVRKIVRLEYIVVNTELDALLLENNLIKKYQPKYNIQLKDDKTYPWICIKNEPFPKVFSTRRMVKDGSKYLGPYPNGRVMHTMLNLIKEMFPLRTCRLDLQKDKIKSGQFKECLEYHIGNCKAPCIGKESEEEYAEYITHIERLLSGDIKEVLSDMKSKMTAFSEAFKFEEAQEIKEKIDLLENYKSKSAVVSSTIKQVDVITVRDDDTSAFVNYLVVKDGAIIHGYTTEIKRSSTRKLQI